MESPLNNPSAPTMKLTLNNIHVHYGQLCALHRVSLEAEASKVIALVGKNGAGKSTLLKTICGLITPSEGHIHWADRPVAKMASRIAYLPQREAVDWNFPITVRGIVEMGRFPYVGWFKKFTKQDDEKVTCALQQMELENLENRQISALSGGQQQRTFIARALAQEADLLLLDEPFNGLDYPSQQNLASVLKKVASQKRLVITSHHDLKTLSEYFDEVIMLNRELVHHGPSTIKIDHEVLSKVFSS